MITARIKRKGLLAIASLATLHLLLNRAHLPSYVLMVCIGLSAYAAAYVLPAFKHRQNLVQALWAVATIGCFFVAGVRFLINDDVFMVMALQAGYTVPFIGKFFSLFLSKLYLIMPAVPWYGLFLLSGNAIVLRMILSIANITNYDKLGVFIFICTSLIIYSPFIFEISYTTSAFGTATTAIIWFSAKLRARQHSNRDYIILSAALIAAFMFRTNASALALLLFSPLLLNTNSKHLIKAALAILPICLLFAIEKSSGIRSPETAEIEYNRFNKLRSKIHDRPENACNYEDALENTNWSANDFNLFKRWLYQHEQFYNIETLETLTESCTEQSDIQNITKNTQKTFSNNIPLYTYVFGIVLLVLYLPLKIKRNEIITLSLSILIFGYLIMFRKLPERVFAPVLFGFIMYALTTPCTKRKTPNWVPIVTILCTTILFDFRVYSVPALSLLLLFVLGKNANSMFYRLSPFILLFFVFAPLISSKQKNQERDLERHELITEKLKEHECLFAYAVPGGYDFNRCISPTEIIQYPATNLFLSWQTFSEYYSDHILKGNGFETASDTWKFFIGNPKVCFIYPEGEPEKLEMLKQFYREHYDTEIDTVQFDQQEGVDFFWIKPAE